MCVLIICVCLLLILALCLYLTQVNWPDSRRQPVVQTADAREAAAAARPVELAGCEGEDCSCQATLTLSLNLDLGVGLATGMTIGSTQPTMNFPFDEVDKKILIQH